MDFYFCTIGTNGLIETELNMEKRCRKLLVGEDWREINQIKAKKKLYRKNNKERRLRFSKLRPISLVEKFPLIFLKTFTETF